VISRDVEALKRTVVWIAAEDLTILKTVLQLGRPQVVIQLDVDIRSLFRRAASKQLQTSALYLKLELLEPVKEHAQ